VQSVVEMMFHRSKASQYRCKAARKGKQITTPSLVDLPIILKKKQISLIDIELSVDLQKQSEASEVQQAKLNCSRRLI
jgi:hypothetical protein